MKDLITVIVPVYNAIQHLQECINSILGQSYKNIEILLIDDGSTDGSGTVCSEFVNYDNRVKFFKNSSNRGVSYSRNVGIQNATGKWIVFVDSDDLLCVNALEKFIEVSYRFSIDLVFGNSYIFRNNHKRSIFNLKEGYFEKVLPNIPSLAVWGYMFRTKTIRDNNIKFVEGLAYSEDAVFLNEYALASRSFAIITNMVYLYREDSVGSACKNPNKLRQMSHQFWAASCIDTLANRMRKNDISSKEIRILLADKLSKVETGIYSALQSTETIPLSVIIQEYKKYPNLNYNIRLIYFLCKLKNMIRNIKKKLICVYF